jgi:hypothetical protein
MKNVSTINANKSLRVLFSTVALFVLLFTSATVHATDNGDKIKNPDVEINYLGTVDYKPIFKVEFDNLTNQEVYFNLKDENGTTIYSEVVKDRKFSRKFQFENIDVNGMKVVLTLRTKGAKDQVYQINQNTHQVEDVVIAKVK